MLIFCINTAFACSCTGYSDDLELDVYQAYVRSSAVVLAESVNITVVKNLRIIEFFTISAWKGIEVERFYVATGAGYCESYFEIGKKYLLYLYGPDDNGYFGSSICSLTRYFSEEKIPEIKILSEIWKRFPLIRKSLVIPKEKFLHN